MCLRTPSQSGQQDISSTEFTIATSKPVWLGYSAWELLFRGILLFGLKEKFGFASANIIQTALSVVAHFGRPYTETVSAIPAGLAFGGIARQTGSIWYVVIIHWVVGMALDWFIVS